MGGKTLKQELLGLFMVKAIKRHLMSGISYMIPVVVAGGILTAVGILIGGEGGGSHTGGYGTDNL